MMELYLQLIHERLDTITRSFKDGPVKEAVRYSLLAPGKRMRPILFLLVLEAYHFPYEKYVDIACAIEMIHTYSLIHDDLPGMDDDDLRRGRPTCHKQFNEATAILAGDTLLNEACLVILNSALSQHLKLKMCQLLYTYSGIQGMIYGQQQDLYFENQRPSLEQLQDLHEHKTGCLIKAPFVMAGEIVGESQLSIWEQIGYKLGLAFQIQDDILDVIGQQDVLGKTIGSDENHHKATYVSLMGLDLARDHVNTYFAEIKDLLNQLTIDSSKIEQYLNLLIKREK